MADEITAGNVTATLTLTKICFDDEDLNQHQVIDKILKCISRNEQVVLELPFYHDVHDGDYENRFRFDATVELQNVIFENIIHIKGVVIWNRCDEKNEYIRCFHFFISLIKEMIGTRKQITYHNCTYELDALSFEGAIHKIADALQQSNNNNDAIESFTFYDYNLTPVTFQLLWDVLLAIGVRKIVFGNDDTTYHRDPRINHNKTNNYKNNNNVDFTGMHTNTSLKELSLDDFEMREKDCRNLFNSIQKNKGLEKLSLNIYDLPERDKRLFKEMLCGNIALLSCIEGYVYKQHKILKFIKFHTELNRMWKRYMKRRKEDKKTSVASAVITAATTAADISTTTTTTTADNANNNYEREEKRKRLKLRMLLSAFINKPVLRDTMIFHLLSEYPDDLVGNDVQQQNQMLLRILGSNVAKNPKKRPYEKKAATSLDD